jgi:hypothetical protein
VRNNISFLLHSTYWIKHLDRQRPLTSLLHQKYTLDKHSFLHTSEALSTISKKLDIMKAITVFFALAAATASTVSATNEGEKLVARDANCDFCFERFDFCIKVRGQRA